MRRWLIVLIFVLSLCGALWWDSARHPIYAQHDQQTQTEHPAEQGRTYPEKSFWKRTTDDPIAVFNLILVAFTGVLAASTIGLWIATLRLSRISKTHAGHMEDAVKAARASANAAEASAVSLQAGERAYVFIEIEEGFIEKMRVIIQQSIDNREGERSRSRYSHSVTINTMPEVSYSFINHGRTPAIVKGIAAAIVYQIESPPANFIGPRTAEIVLNTGAVIKSKTVARLIIDPPTADSLRAGRGFMWFYGCIIYDDVFGKERETRFCWCYDGVASSFRQSGDEHNRRT